MKRSRRSEYDKRRNRSKKHSERKLNYASKPKESNETAQPSSDVNKELSRKATAKKDVTHTFQNREIPTETFTQTRISNHPMDYKVLSRNDKTYKQRTTFRRKRSFFATFRIPIIVIIIFVSALLLLMKFTSSQKAKTSRLADPVFEEVEFEPAPMNYDSLQKTRRKRNRQRIMRTDATKLITGSDVSLTAKKSTGDFVKRILPNAVIRLPKEFTRYDTKAFPEIAILAKDSLNYFFYSSEQKESGKVILGQWSASRKKYVDERANDYFYYESGTWLHKRSVREARFSYIYKGFVLYGAAVLIEHNNRCHFFQLMEKKALDDKPNYAEVRQKLYRYLELKLPDK